MVAPTGVEPVARGLGMRLPRPPSCVTPPTVEASEVAAARTRVCLCARGLAIWACSGSDRPLSQVLRRCSRPRLPGPPPARGLGCQGVRRTRCAESTVERVRRPGRGVLRMDRWPCRQLEPAALLTALRPGGDADERAGVVME